MKGSQSGLGSSTVLVLKYIFISTWCMEMSKYLYLYLTKKYLVLSKYYLLKSVKVANYLNTLLQLSLYLIPTTDSIVGFVASLA